MRSSISRLSLLAALTLAAGAAVPLSALAQTAPATPPNPPTPPTAANAAAAPRVANESVIPVRRITLYRSGVGYFERSGTISGNEQIQLRFKTEQINDILKSMVLLDLDGGRIDSVSYASKEPLSKRLASFGINIADNPTAGQILERLRGTPVRLTTHEGEHSGTIMNVEKRPTVFQPAAGGGGPGAASVFDLPWINLLTDKGVRSYDLTKVTGFEILDKQLAAELDKALSTIAEYRADTSKTVDLRLSGAGSRRVMVGYVQESPVWKTSYRLVLPDKDPSPSEGNKGSLVMQGWAIVENTTDTDWTDVQLALVSGRPVSFQMDLYEPLFTYRPMVPVPTIAGVMPRAYAGGVDLDNRDRLAAESKRLERRSMARAGAPASPAPAMAEMSIAMDQSQGGGGGQSPFEGYKGVSGDDLVNYAAQAQAGATEAGEVFQYEVKTPVTVERQRSAMIPIINANITGRRVSIFSAMDGRPNPMRGVELVNESDLQLLPGPISVYDGAAYAGDAQINHISKGDKRLLAYSVDLDVNILTRPDSQSTIRKIRIADGLIIQTITTTQSMSYAIDNNDTKRARTLIIEQPRMEGWTLTTPARATEETQDLHRFEVPVEAGKPATFSVVYERTDSQSMAVTSIDLPTIIGYHKNGKLSNEVLKAFQEISRRQSEINTVEREIAELDRQKNDIDSEQARIRENIGRIDRSSQLYTRYMTKLTEQETQLEDLRERRNTATARLEGLRSDFNNYVRTLNVE